MRLIFHSGLFALLSLMWPLDMVQAQQPITLFEVTTLAESDPKAAIQQIDNLVSSGSVTDRRTLFDLQLLKAELLEATTEISGAAALYLQLGQAAQQDRFTYQWDATALFERAADLYRRLGDDRRTELALLALLEDLRNGGASAQEISGVLDQLSEVARGAAASEYQEAAKSAREAPAPSRSAGSEGGYREVDVFYATDRARTGDPRPSRFYGGERGTLELGVAQVTIPNTHTAGAIEAPSIWRLEFGPNPAKHVVLKSVTPVKDEVFWTQMNDKMGEIEKTDALVFIHGFNVRFDAAAKRAAQLAHDMNFPGVPILYSWPSRGKTMGYIPDTAVVRLSGRRLSRFLDDLVEKSGATNIHIVAHSMGNRALTDALELLALRRDIEAGDDPVFGQILFAAPDVDAELFSEMMPVIRPLARRLTLYASDQDWALVTSKQLHGNAPRAGQGGEDLIARPEFDSVDMSELGEDMLAHSYFADDSSALADMVALFWRNAPPNRRCGLEQQLIDAEQPVWQYIAGRCADQTLVEVMTHLQQAQVTDANTAEKIVVEKVPDPQVASVLVPIVSNLLDN